MHSESPRALAARISAAAKSEGVRESTFCQKHFRGSRIFLRLSAGNDIEAATYRKIIDKIGPPHSQEAMHDAYAPQPRPSDFPTPSSEKQPIEEPSQSTSSGGGQ